MSTIPFRKMHGLGNDFVVIDARGAGPLPVGLVRAIAARRTGIGCDTVIAIEPSARADAFMRIHNADGSEVGACGNAARCVAALLMAERGRADVSLETLAGVLPATAAERGRISVDMGPARTDWREIPLARAMDTLHVDLSVGPLSAPTCVGMGNPHAVFFVADAEAVDLTAWGPQVEHHALFPERTNVEVVTVLSPAAIRLRVWERGVGITAACGSGACAGAVAAHRRGLTGRSVAVHVDGGRLDIVWRDDNHVVMTGPVATSFVGSFDPADYAEVA